MDLATIIGLVLAFGLIFVPIIISGMIASFIDIGSMMIVIGGAFAALLASYSLKDFLRIGKYIQKTIKADPFDPGPTVNKLVELSEKARREGILALEKEFGSIENEFMKKAIQLAVDGNEVDVIESVIGNEIDNIEERHKIGHGMFSALGSYAPAFGMIGTLVGLVQMLQALDDPANIGVGMAIALITTFYGSVLANALFIPLGKKLERNTGNELLLKNMILAGIISIQNGDNPRVLRDKLETFLPPDLRQGKEDNG
ncbi:MAG: motility protein A [Candidatus Cloacimonadota bacterium]|nr:motility protein A [Candidatus Cloacimonadota bacterium]